jgi:hypothetical protein
MVLLEKRFDRKTIQPTFPFSPYPFPYLFIMPIDLTTAIARVFGGALTYAHLKDGRVLRIETMTELNFITPFGNEYPVELVHFFCITAY